MTSLSPIIPNTSKPATADFVGREATTRRAETMLRAGQNLLVSDPRRMGKTFWLRTLADRETAGHHVVFIDYQGVNTIDEFLLRTVRDLAPSDKLPQRFRGLLKTWFDNIEVGVAAGPITVNTAVAASNKTPLELLEAMLVRLDADLAAESKGKSTDKSLVIAMDEVSDAAMAIIDRADAATGRNLLARLRYLRDKTTNVRWIVAGSIGFHHVLGRAGTTPTVLAGLSNLPLGPLDVDDAAELARRLALGIDRSIDEAAVDAVVRITGGIPSLIQKLFDLMRFDRHNQPLGNAPITADTITEAFEDFLNDRDQSRDVTHYVSRIETYYGQNSKLAHAILRATARTSDWLALADLRGQVGETTDEFFTVLNNLIDDHYLVQRPVDGADSVKWRHDVIRVIYARREPSRA